MAFYTTWVSYFETLAIQNKKIKHAVGVQPHHQKFFCTTLENFFLATTTYLPDPKLGPFMHFIDYVRTIDWQKGSAKELDKHQVMFFVLQAYKSGDTIKERQAKDACQNVVNEILARMKFDSKNGDPVLKRAFDVISNVRVVPHTRVGALPYTGWQVSILLNVPFDTCFNSNDWDL